MQINITASTCAPPAMYAAEIMANIRDVLPDAIVNVRPIPAPASRQFQTVEVIDSDHPHLHENIVLLCELVRVWLVDDALDYGSVH